MDTGLTIFAKRSILDICQGSDTPLAMTAKVRLTISFRYSSTPYCEIFYIFWKKVLNYFLIFNWKTYMKNVWKATSPLTLNDTCISESCIEIKIKLNFYFALLCGASKGFMKALKDFIKSYKIFWDTTKKCLKGLHKTFWDTTKKCKNKNLT